LSSSPPYAPIASSTIASAMEPTAMPARLSTRATLTRRLAARVPRRKDGRPSLAAT
jgi:hypothetical protein